MLSLSSSTNNSIHCSESVSGIRIEAGCSAVSISIIEKATNRRNLDYFSHSIFLSLFVRSFMKVAALLSGGKDSCYNMIECVRHGHQIVCLVNLCPGIA